VKILGKLNYNAYYRKRPAIGNVASVALESWYLGITVLYMISRVAKILVAVMLFLARVDTPILAERSVNFILDPFPYVYRKDLLAAEAHRHPYIEQLGMTYLMNLRYRDEFAKPSESIWRILFVRALMPWLRKDRTEIDQTEEAQQATFQSLAQRSDYDEIVHENYVVNPTNEHRKDNDIDVRHKPFRIANRKDDGNNVRKVESNRKDGNEIYQTEEAQQAMFQSLAQRSDYDEIVHLLCSKR